MSEMFKRWYECDPDRAERVGRAVRLWTAYLGLVCFGVIVGGGLVYLWGRSQVAETRAAHLDEVQRLQAINSKLLGMIEDRLPEITSQVGNAADTASDAVQKAEKAVRAAEGAGAVARSASSTVKKAADTLNEALEPSPAQSVPDWLDGP